MQSLPPGKLEKALEKALEDLCRELIEAALARQLVRFKVYNRISDQMQSAVACRKHGLFGILASSDEAALKYQYWEALRGYLWERMQPRPSLEVKAVYGQQWRAAKHQLTAEKIERIHGTYILAKCDGARENDTQTRSGI